MKKEINQISELSHEKGDEKIHNRILVSEGYMTTSVWMSYDSDENISVYMNNHCASRSNENKK